MVLIRKETASNPIDISKQNVYKSTVSCCKVNLKKKKKRKKKSSHPVKFESSTVSLNSRYFTHLAVLQVYIEYENFRVVVRYGYNVRQFTGNDVTP